jgi:Bacterial Ig-like domain (group 3)
VHTTRFQRKATGLALIAAVAVGGVMSAVPAGASRQATLVPTPVTIATTTTLKTSTPIVFPGQFGQVTARVRAVTITLSNPTGSVTFVVNGVRASTSKINRGTAIFDLGSAAPGTYVITAKYSGDATFAGSKSAPMTMIVAPPGVHS